MVGSGSSASSGNKIVATLRADGKVYPSSEGASIPELSNLMSYKKHIESDRKAAVTTCLTENVIPINSLAIDAGKQLLQCARDKDLEGVKIALTRAAPFTSDWLGMSPLHFAAMNDQWEMCEVLLNAGINKDSKTKVDRTPLHLACFYGNEKVVEILLSRACAVNAKDMLKMTPLHWAVEKGYKSIVRLLLKHGADVTAVSKFGRTPIGCAVLTEQADLLEELEAARQNQINFKFSEKETSEAVNSIMDPGSNNSNDGEVMEETINELVDDDGLTDKNEKIIDLDNIKEVGVLGDSAVKLLKSHGITMMTQDDQESKKLLNTALQNGRQLILSEGGKLLLNETKKIQHNHLNNDDKNNTNNSIHKIIKVPVSYIKNDIAAVKKNTATIGSVPNCSTKDPTKTISISETKYNPNIIKSKDHMMISGKGKSVRIISLNDFKKLYANANIKTFQNLPTALTENRLVKIRAISNQQVQQKQLINNNQTKGINAIENEIKNVNFDTTTANSTGDNINIIECDNSLRTNDTITGESTEVEKELDNSRSPPPLKIIQPPPGTHRLQQKHPQIQLLPTRRLINASQLRHVTGINNNNNNTNNNNSSNNKNINNNNFKPYDNNYKQSSSTTVPLLTLPEICRQLMELRKHCEDFRNQKDELRKLELAQKDLRKQNDELRKQNEEFRLQLLEKQKEDLNRNIANERDINTRLDRLEELLLLERTDDDVNTS